ncbi:MAG: RNase adapter RapZ [Proteobacteria bacterium]|nr:RNase adapter RapZ [Pseudomonadota bacterium]
MNPHLVHATCVAIDGADGPLGVLLRGPPGAGKSDLALRLIDRGARLVADDQCELRCQDGAAGARLVARAPASIAGVLEVRGLGIMEVPSLAEAPVALVVDLVDPDEVERLPTDAAEEILGLELPRIALNAFEAAAPAKLHLALRHGAMTRAAETAAADPSAVSPEPGQAPPGAGAPSGSSGAPRRVVVVTGLSGAGRSTALKILEDLGYEAIDNLPLDLLSSIAGAGGPMALGIDIRTRNFAAEPVLDRLDRLGAEPGLAVTLLFLDCDDEVIERRYTETRRRHPLAQDRRVADGIAAERRLIAPLRARADLMLDTSNLSPADLRRLLGGHLGLDRAPGMAIFVTSFAYRAGLPREADLVFDVRFLANPHYQADLRELDGRDPRVAAYVEGDPAYSAFFDRLTGMLGPLLPSYEREGKSYLTVAIGCTGGRHRSVAVAERLAAWLRGLGRRVDLSHRELAPGVGRGHNGRDSAPETR